jgi:hypothetical protein
MIDAVGLSFLLKALGYGIPAAMLVLTVITLPVIIKYFQSKQDKDRREHMAKWDSMVAMQKESINTIIASHAKELDRSFTLYERQAAAFEGMNHNLAIMMQTLQTKHFCPNNLTRSTDNG